MISLFRYLDKKVGIPKVLKHKSNFPPPLSFFNGIFDRNLINFRIFFDTRFIKSKNTGFKLKNNTINPLSLSLLFFPRRRHDSRRGAIRKSNERKMKGPHRNFPVSTGQVCEEWKERRNEKHCGRKKIFSSVGSFRLFLFNVTRLINE